MHAKDARVAIKCRTSGRRVIANSIIGGISPVAARADKMMTLKVFEDSPNKSEICKAPTVEVVMATDIKILRVSICVGRRNITKEEERAQPHKKKAMRDLSTAKHVEHVLFPWQHIV